MDEATCRVCGCTDVDPCITDLGETCAWVEPDLCNFCAEIEGASLVVPVSEYGAQRFIDKRRRLIAAGGAL
jgi:transcription elongation factor Elf1